ncbi:MAG: hypothetical protein OXI01_01960 [Albidovulum sp.]|nr:hypothetical protein [Albidovulum sp.]
MDWHAGTRGPQAARVRIAMIRGGGLAGDARGSVGSRKTLACPTIAAAIFPVYRTQPETRFLFQVALAAAWFGSILIEKVFGAAGTEDARKDCRGFRKRADGDRDRADCRRAAVALRGYAARRTAGADARHGVAATQARSAASG